MNPGVERECSIARPQIPSSFALHRFEQLELFERFERLRRRHRALHTSLLKLVLVVFAHIGIFVGVFDQRAALFDVDVDALFAAFVGDFETDGMV